MGCSIIWFNQNFIYFKRYNKIRKIFLPDKVRIFVNFRFKLLFPQVRPITMTMITMVFFIYFKFHLSQLNYVLHLQITITTWCCNYLSVYNNYCYWFQKKMQFVWFFSHFFFHIELDLIFFFVMRISQLYLFYIFILFSFLSCLEIIRLIL